MAPFVVDTDNDSRSSPVSADNSATRIVMTADTQSKSSPAIESCAIEDGCYYSEFFESGGVDKSNNDMSNTSTTFCSWYSTKTETHPLLTSSLTGGICACVGDVIAQFIENSTNLRQDSTNGLHYRRTIAVFTAGLCYGPLLQTMYATLDQILPIHCKDKDNCLFDNAATDSKEEDDIDISAISREIVDDTSVVTPVSNYCYSTMFHSFSLVSTKVYVNAFIHVAIDQGIMAFPFVALMMFVTGIVEGHWNKLGQEFSEDYIDNIHALWLAAIFGIGPLQIIAFRYLDLKWRALAANLLDVLEVMVMSYLTHRNREAPQYESNDDDDSWNYETHNYGGGSADE